MDPMQPAPSPLFDALLPVGRTNRASADAPADEAEALALMERLGVAEALVCHTLALDANADAGNAALERTVRDPRLHRVFAFDTDATREEPPAVFLERALARGAKAVLVNPAGLGIRLHGAPRLHELAGLLGRRRVPLLLRYRTWAGGADLIDWYELAEFCNRFPDLPVIAGEWRTRANRPLFDALAATANLRVLLSCMWQAQMLECVCDRFGPERVVFSLGLPELLAASFPPVLAYADLDEETRSAVARGNLQRLLAEADHA